MIDKFLSFSIKMKLVVVLVPIIIVGSIVGVVILNNQNTKTELTSATSKNLGIEEEVVLEVKEEVVVVAKDTTIDESLKEEKEEVVKFKDKEVKIPKSKVSSVKSAEDAETNKKTGGDKVSQDQAQTMFENVGQKSMGIDVSHHQGKINWAKVRESGVEFAIIRVGYRGQTSGGIYEDAYFKTNMNGAIANGIKVGVYFYSTAINENEALEEAAWVVKKIAPYSVTYPVVYDFEDFNAKRCANVGGAQATSNALTYLNFVKANGYEPMMYANKNDITTKMSRSSFNCKFWLAHYTSQTDYTGNVNMWQYTSKGSVPGISGWVDMNIAYFNYGTTAAPKHTHEYNEEVKNSYKAPTCDASGSKVMACSCGEKETKTLEPLGHKWGDWKTKIEATKDETGTKVRICQTCEKEETEVIDKLKDDSNSNTNTNTNTNTSKDEGNENNTVENTNTSGNVVPGNKHEHNFTEEVLESYKAPTCEEPGSKEMACSCGEKETKSIDALGHAWNNWQTTQEPTTETEGIKSRKCGTCEEEETGTIEKLKDESKADNTIANEVV